MRKLNHGTHIIKPVLAMFYVALRLCGLFYCALHLRLAIGILFGKALV